MIRFPSYAGDAAGGENPRGMSSLSIFSPPHKMGIKA